MGHYGGVKTMHLLEQALGGHPNIEPKVIHPKVDNPVFSRLLESVFLPASTQSRVANACNVQVEYKPILLGALFDTIGTANIPSVSGQQSRRI